MNTPSRDYFFHFLLVALPIVAGTLVAFINLNSTDVYSVDFTPRVTHAATDPSLVGYWKFDEGSGTTANDSSGNTNTGTLVNGPTWTTGKAGQALNFDGVNDYVNMGTALDILGDKTISLWVKTTNSHPSGTHSAFVARWDSAGYIFWANGTSIDWGDLDSDELIWTGGNTALEDGVWHHLVAVRSGAGGSIWFDGVQKASKTTGFTDSSADIFIIGAYRNGDSGRFSGLIDEVRVYNRALSTAEVQSLYNEATPPDTQLPTVSITAPVNSASVSGISAAISANVSDNVGVVGVQFKLDGSNLGTEDTFSPYGLAWDTTTASNGSHILTAVARDAAGNIGTASNVTVTVNNALPDTPGGFIEKSDTVPNRPTLTAAQIQSLLPQRGKFTFPAPYNTKGIRITNSSDCGGADCVNYVGYSYWRNMNNSVNSDTMLIFLDLSRNRGGEGTTLFSLNKTTDVLTKVGPLFGAADPLSWAISEGWYFSGTQPTKLYLINTQTQMIRYDVISKQRELIYDVSSRPDIFGANRIIWQMHSSDDDRVHSATLRDGTTYNMLGCLVYREDTKQFSYFPSLGIYFDECHVDKSGRWLLLFDKIDNGPSELDNRIIDLTTGAEVRLLDRDGAPGHLDMGYGYMVGADNYDSRPNAWKLWKFNQSPLQGVLVTYGTNWNSGAPNHASHLNARPGVPPEEQYACASTASRVTNDRANEVICFPLDGSQRVLVVAPVMTDMNASGGGDDYSKLPKGNIDSTGKYFIWTSNMGGNRLDAFIVKVPSQLLTGNLPPPDTQPPTVPTGFSVIAVSQSQINLSWNASTDNIAVSGYRIYRSGTQIATTPTTNYSDSNLQPSTTYTYTVSAYDAAGNTSSQSSSVSATIQASSPNPSPTPSPSPTPGSGSPSTGSTLFPSSGQTSSPPSSSVLPSSGPSGSSSGGGEGNFYTPSPQTSTSTITRTTSLPVPTRELYFGLTHSDVTLLQQILKAEGLFTYPEFTTYFGSITRSAVIAFQRNYQIPQTGYVGPLTLAKLKERASIFGGSSASAPLSPSPSFTRNLYIGLQGSDVTRLQVFLITKGFLGMGNNTGYFGPLTEDAVRVFQCEQGIVCSGTPASTGWGVVGPKTRVVLNTLMGN